MNIRNYIIQNFKNNSTSEIKQSIEESIQEKEEVTLPGLGVLFELLWNESDNSMRENILQLLQKSLD